MAFFKNLRAAFRRTPPLDVQRATLLEASSVLRGDAARQKVAAEHAVDVARTNLVDGFESLAPAAVAAFDATRYLSRGTKYTVKGVAHGTAGVGCGALGSLSRFVEDAADGLALYADQLADGFERLGRFFGAAPASHPERTYRVFGRCAFDSRTSDLYFEDAERHMAEARRAFHHAWDAYFVGLDRSLTSASAFSSAASSLSWLVGHLGESAGRAGVGRAEQVLSLAMDASAEALANVEDDARRARDLLMFSAKLAFRVANLIANVDTEKQVIVSDYELRALRRELTRLKEGQDGFPLS